MHHALASVISCTQRTGRNRFGTPLRLLSTAANRYNTFRAFGRGTRAPFFLITDKDS